MPGPAGFTAAIYASRKNLVTGIVATDVGGQIGTTEVIETLYQLTHAEAELVRLIAEGNSLEEVAAERGVTMNTVRSQLKQVFSKTGTSRQGELVQLVLRCLLPMAEE